MPRENLFNEEIRDTARGGRDQFSWEKVAQDKQRGCYLGNSLFIPHNRQMAKQDVFWYAKEREGREQEVEDELAQVKAQEEAARQAILGGGGFEALKEANPNLEPVQKQQGKAEKIQRKEERARIRQKREERRLRKEEKGVQNANKQ